MCAVNAAVNSDERNTPVQRVVIAVGRFNPPTRGHSILVEQLQSSARSLQAHPHVLVVEGAKSQNDTHRNPLSGIQRVDILQQWFPQVQVSLVSSAYNAMDWVRENHFQLAAWVAGSDRATKFEALMRHAGETQAHVVPVDRIAGDAPGVSATLARQAVMENNWQQFVRMMPRNAHKHSLEIMWDLIRQQGGHGLQQFGLRDHPNQ